MKRFILFAICLPCLAVVSTCRAGDFKQSKVTQVVNDVQIISGADQAKKSASVDDIFKMPDILRTGPSSRAELVAEDDTVTRVGANTIFGGYEMESVGVLNPVSRIHTSGTMVSNA